MGEEIIERGRKCPSCGHEPLVRQRIRDEFEYGPDDERITIVAEAVPVLACPACGETLFGPEAAAVHHQAICLRVGTFESRRDQGHSRTLRAGSGRLRPTDGDWSGYPVPMGTRPAVADASARPLPARARCLASGRSISQNLAEARPAIEWFPSSSRRRGRSPRPRRPFRAAAATLSFLQIRG